MWAKKCSDLKSKYCLKYNEMNPITLKAKGRDILSTPKTLRLLRLLSWKKIFYINFY